MHVLLWHLPCLFEGEIRFEGTIVEISLFVLIILGPLLAERDLVCCVSFSTHLHSSQGMSGQRLRECVLIHPWGSCGLLIFPAS